MHKHQRDNRAEFQRSFKERHKFPEGRIGCTCCDNFTVMHNESLDRWISKAGSFDKLLDTFQCQGCRGGKGSKDPSAPKMVIAAVHQEGHEKEWVAYYKEHDKFPHLKVGCIKCKSLVSMFGDNLKKRIQRFGGPDKLLKEFECRDCRAPAAKAPGATKGAEVFVHQRGHEKEWVEFFEKHKKFPQKKVGCVDCNHLTDMFSTNLNNRIERFGGPMQLLTQFQCRACRPESAKRVVNKGVKRGRKAVREEHIEALKESARNLKCEYNITTIPLDDKHQGAVEEVTRGNNCWRPDMFLDNGRACNGCSLFKHCLCSFKRIKEDKKSSKR